VLVFLPKESTKGKLFRGSFSEEAFEFRRKFCGALLMLVVDGFLVLDRQEIQHKPSNQVAASNLFDR